MFDADSVAYFWSNDFISTIFVTFLIPSISDAEQEEEEWPFIKKTEKFNSSNDFDARVCNSFSGLSEPLLDNLAHLVWLIVPTVR